MAFTNGLKSALKIAVTAVAAACGVGAANATIIGYEITYQTAGLFHRYNVPVTGPVTSPFWADGGFATPQDMTFRIELAQDPAEIQSSPVIEGGLQTGINRDFEIARLDLLFDDTIVMTDSNVPFLSNGAFIVDAFPGSLNRSDFFRIRYINNLSFGNFTFSDMTIGFQQPGNHVDADTWLQNAALPTAAQLDDLAQAPFFRFDFDVPSGGSGFFMTDRSTPRPVIRAIELTPVPLPAGLPMLLAGVALVGFAGRNKRSNAFGFTSLHNRT